MTVYSPQPDVEGVNSSQASPIKDLAILLAGFAVVISFLYWSLGEIGEWLVLKLSPETEIRLFQKINFGDAFTMQASSDLEKIQERLLAERPLDLKIGVVCFNEPNAFAMPGGKIFITSGLMKKVRTEKGLAFVVAHEIGHFLNRDHLRGLGRGMATTLLVAMIGLDVSSGLNVDSIGQVWLQKNSREAEVKADVTAMSLVEKAYGDLSGSEEFFRVLRQDELLRQGVASKIQSLNSLWQSHPAPEERMRAIREAIESKELQSTGKPTSVEIAQAAGDFSVAGCEK